MATTLFGLGVLIGLVGLFRPIGPIKTKWAAGLVLALSVWGVVKFPQPTDQFPARATAQSAPVMPKPAGIAGPQGPIQPAVIGASVGAVVSVPSDKNANYELVEISSKVGGKVKILTKRSGRSGVAFSRRECSCGNKTFRYLGDGATLAEAKRSKVPAEPFVALISSNGLGSVSYHVCGFACRFYRVP